MRERVRHVNRMKGLLAGQGITDYDPLQKDRRASLETVATGDGHPLPDRLKAELSRELDVADMAQQGACVFRRQDLDDGSDHCGFVTA